MRGRLSVACSMFRAIVEVPADKKMGDLTILCFPLACGFALFHGEMTEGISISPFFTSCGSALLYIQRLP